MESIVREEFEARQKDLEAYIELIEFLYSLENSEVFGEKDGDLVGFRLDDSLFNILGSVLYLVSYNQVEASVRGCLESLYDHIEDNQTSYDDLKEGIQSEILKGIKANKKSLSDLRSNLSGNLGTNIPRESFDVKNIINGNITKRAISAIKENYELEVNAPEDTRDGVDITTLKNARNNLAHGENSFSQYGARDSFNGHIEVSRRSMNYLSVLIRSFDDYIDSREYLSCSNRGN